MKGINISTAAFSTVDWRAAALLPRQPTLESLGRVLQQLPQGAREVEIHLREQERQLESLQAQTVALKK